VKPPFRLPSMAEVAAARGTAGLTVASTFAGCGGSCLGFEMAGFRTVWANEFVPAAREVYAANHPGVPLDDRDIRKVQPADVLGAVGLERGELDVLNGSPPCASFSMSGKRDAHWGEVKKYSDRKQRTDDLFFEFVRLLDGIQPRAFVAENVAAITQGVAVGYFKEIVRALEGAGYRVACRILDAQWLGVPQTRRRAIILGVRKDLDREPDFPKPLGYRYSLRDVLPDLKRRAAMVGPGLVRDGSIVGTAIEKEWRKLTPYRGKLREWARLHPGQKSSKYLNLIRASPDEPSPCITAAGGGRGVASVTHPYEPRKFSIDELRRVCGFPADFVLTGTYQQQWERLGRAVPPPMMRAVAAALRDGLFTELDRTRRKFREAS